MPNRGENNMHGIEVDETESSYVGNRKYFRLFSVVFAVFAAVSILYVLWGGEKTNFGELALGEFTSSVYGTYDGDQIHCRDIIDVESCILPAESRTLPKSVLWLGNSQLHGINNLKPGQYPASTMLVQKFRPRGVEILTFSQPNASLREHYVMFEYLQSKYKFDVLLLPVVFDDTREGSVRQDIAIGAKDQKVFEKLKDTSAGRAILKQIGSASKDTKEKEKTLQDRSEEWLTSALEKCCGWKTLRREAKGSIFRTIYYSRNRLFGINPSTQRRRLPATYQSNLDAFEAILNSAKSNGIAVIAYIAPLRSDVPSPYNHVEYSEFKKSIAELVNVNGGMLLNLENLVPGKFWGQEGKSGGKEGLDFMHFQFDGHKLLSDALAFAIEKVAKNDL